MDKIILNGVVYKKGDSVILSSDYGTVSGTIHNIGNWLYKREDGSEYTKPFVHVKYDRPGLYNIKECWLWTDDHFRTMSHLSSGCSVHPDLGWIVHA